MTPSSRDSSPSPLRKSNAVAPFQVPNDSCTGRSSSTSRSRPSLPALRNSPGGRSARGSEFTAGPLSRLFAAIYDSFTAWVEQQVFSPQRERLLEAATGRVLDMGAGTGTNLAHYRKDRVSELILLDPSPGMLNRARLRASELHLEPQILANRAEEVPWADARSTAEAQLTT
jgi:SAM-dependent methyltransferase